MSPAGRGEKFFLALSLVLFVAGIVLAARTGEPLAWSRSRLFLPAGILSLAAVNAALRSKVLAWGVFTGSFVLFMVVFGPWVLGLRAVASVETLKFMRAMALFLCLSITGLLQLRAARGGR